jgi:uncharacterized coiled-coil protein SlyX
MATTEELQAQLTELETRYAFQQDELRQLDEVIRGLADRVDLLTREVAEVRSQARESGTPNKIEDEVPPHY